MTLSDIEIYILKCIKVLKFNSFKSNKYNKYKIKVLEKKLNYILLELRPINVFNLKSKTRMNKNKLIFNVYIEAFEKNLYCFEYNVNDKEVDKIEKIY